ncbi:hypothetical protein C1645_819080 [Glomus cerebriforme]|uniref:Uncharacterized protein n=1 Tax=Glomus cerebriforme TaxID=658196 RepID=A0A397T755_9GLOM|nr:hypothetical protein C1645_819080 [Glomus cerebriforme]
MLSNEYLSNSNSYSNNKSDCESDDYNNYESDCDKEVSCTPARITDFLLIQLSNIKEALYQIFDCNWEDILKGLVITTLSDPNKCNYYILYTLALLIDHHELKAHRSSWKTGKTYILEHLTISNNMNLLVLSTYHSYSNAITTRLNLKLYYDIDSNINLSDHKRVLDKIVSIIAQSQSHLSQKDKIFHLASNKEIVLAKLWNWAKQIASLSFKN